MVESDLKAPRFFIKHRAVRVEQKHPETLFATSNASVVKFWLDMAGAFHAWDSVTNTDLWTQEDLEKALAEAPLKTRDWSQYGDFQQDDFDDFDDFFNE